MSEAGSPSLVMAASALVMAVLTVLFLVLAALLDRTGPIRVRHWVENAGGDLRRLFDQTERFEAFRYLIGFLGRAAPAILVALLTLALVPVLGGTTPAILWALAAVSVITLLTEALSRFMAARAEPFLNRFTFAYRALLAVLRPLLPLTSILFVVQESGEDDEASDDEIEAYLDVGAKEGILEPGEEDMILRVIDFGDEVVRAVMTPRIDMICASIETPVEELAELFVSSNHSRIPLYRESVDDIRGVLHIRDLLGATRSENPVVVESLAMPPLFVPETKPLAELLRQLQSSHLHLAVVVDEYGGTSGLVTIEDLLEEIVGEIVDEHDDVEAEVEKLADGSYRLDGMTSLDALETLFGRDLDDEPYETIGGLVFGCIGDLPTEGATVQAHGLKFVVESVGERRIESLRVAVVRQGDVRGSDEAS